MMRFSAICLVPALLFATSSTAQLAEMTNAKVFNRSGNIKTSVNTSPTLRTKAVGSKAVYISKIARNCCVLKAVQGLGKPIVGLNERNLEKKLLKKMLEKIKPYWKPPTGIDAEKLRTDLYIQFNRDGTVARIFAINTSGVTDSNRGLAPIHVERAVRAVRRAGPFSLPAGRFEEWQILGPITFRTRL